MGKGRPREVSDRELIEAGKASTGPAWTTREIAEQLNISTQTARERFRTLAEEGVVNSKREAGVTILWLPETDAR
jgi:DNA-binding GntR family transcriptional regulator